MSPRFPIARRRHARAFTLVELLIAGAISSLLLGALFALLFGTLRLREAAFRTTESGPPREQVAELIRHDLLGAVAPSGTLAGTFLGQGSGSLRDEQTLLTFYTTTGILGENLPWGEIQQVEYELADPLDGETHAGLDLRRRVTRNLLSSSVEEDDEEDPALRILHGVQTLTLEFWDGEDWQEEWDSTAQENANPTAVRLRVDFAAEGDQPAEPPLEVICEMATQPRTAATATASGGDSASTPAADGAAASGAGTGDGATPQSAEGGDAAAGGAPPAGGGA